MRQYYKVYQWLSGARNWLEVSAQVPWVRFRTYLSQVRDSKVLLWRDHKKIKKANTYKKGGKLFNLIQDHMNTDFVLLFLLICNIIQNKGVTLSPFKKRTSKMFGIQIYVNLGNGWGNTSAIWMQWIAACYNASKWNKLFNSIWLIDINELDPDLHSSNPIKY